jgi:hypothetical protein
MYSIRSTNTRNGYLRQDISRLLRICAIANNCGKTVSR